MMSSRARNATTTTVTVPRRFRDVRYGRMTSPPTDGSNKAAALDRVGGRGGVSDFLNDRYLPGLFLLRVPNSKLDLHGPDIDPDRGLKLALGEEPDRAGVGRGQGLVPVNAVSSLVPRVEHPLAGKGRVEGDCRGRDRRQIGERVFGVTEGHRGSGR